MSGDTKALAKAIGIFHCIINDGASTADIVAISAQVLGSDSGKVDKDAFADKLRRTLKGYAALGSGGKLPSFTRAVQILAEATTKHKLDVRTLVMSKHFSHASKDAADALVGAGFGSTWVHQICSGPEHVNTP